MRQSEVSPINAYVGKRIADLRKYRGLSQDELSKMVDVSRTTIVSWETGKSGVDVTGLSKLTKALHARADYFLGLGEFSLAGVFPAGYIDETDNNYFTYFSIFANDFTERQKQLYLSNLKAFTEINFNDAKAIIFNRSLSDMASDEEFDALYSVNEIQACLQKHYGISVDLRNNGEVSKLIENVQAAGRRHRDKNLIETIKKEIYRDGFLENYPDDLKQKIEEELHALGDLLYQEGYAMGEAEAIFEQGERMADALNEEYEIDADEYRRDWDDTFTDLPSSEDFEIGYEEGKKETQL